MAAESPMPEANDEPEPDSAAHQQEPNSADVIRSGTVDIRGDTVVGRDMWIATVAAMAIPLVPFFNSFMSKAGEDAYLALKNFIRDRLKTDNQDRLILEDSETQIRIEVTAELPDEAFRQLLQIDPDELARPPKAVQAPMRWDDSLDGWVPPS